VVRKFNTLHDESEYALDPTVHMHACVPLGSEIAASTTETKMCMSWCSAKTAHAAVHYNIITDTIKSRISWCLFGRLVYNVSLVERDPPASIDLDK